MWVPKKKWIQMQKEIDELKKDHLSLDKNIRKSIESNKQLILIVKELYRCLEKSADTSDTNFTEKLSERIE